MYFNQIEKEHGPPPLAALDAQHGARLAHEATAMSNTKMIPLPRSDLARMAPDYEAMRSAIAVCERLDEIANLTD